MSGSAAKRPRPRKPYYELTELCEAWSLTASDIESYVLAQELTVSIAVAGQPVLLFDVEEDDEGQPFTIPAGRLRAVGTIDLNCTDAWTVLHEGSCEVSWFWNESGHHLRASDSAWESQALVVKHAEIVVRRAEKERFELAQGLVQPLGTESESEGPASPRRSRGAPPKYDWEGCWCEISAMIYDPGPPATQAEWLEKLRDWFTAQLGPDNIPSDSAIKQRLSRIWPRVKPDVGRPSASMLVNGARAAGAGEKGGLRRR
jgi:hypothetical protein